jgi:hypothetical protein
MHVGLVAHQINELDVYSYLIRTKANIDEEILKIRGYKMLDLFRQRMAL